MSIDRPSLSVRYSGEAAAGHAIGVRDLAPSLLSLADAFDVAYRYFGAGLSSVPELEVRATEKGSFIVELGMAIQDSGEAMLEWAKSPNGAATGVLATLGLPMLTGLQILLKRARSGPPETVVDPVAGEVKCVWPDGTEIRGPESVLGLIEDMDFRRSVHSFYSPLAREGIDAVEVRYPPTRSVVRAEGSDYSLLRPPESVGEPFGVTRRTVRVRPVAVSFNIGNKWRVSDEAGSFWASVEDWAFLRRVDAGEVVFSRDDLMLVRLREERLRTTDGGTKIEHAIETVLEHRSGAPQETLPGF